MIYFFIKENDIFLIYKNLFICISLIFLIGLIDDIINLNYLIRLLSLYLVITIFLWENNSFQINYLFFEFGNDYTFIINKISYVITPLFIMLLINSLNMADGINGNVGLIFLTYFLLLFNTENNSILLPIFILIPLIIFLLFNLNNKLYLGDSGVYLLSAIISFYTINEYNLNNTNISCERIFLVFMIPGIDMFRLFYERILNKKNPFIGDLKHLHHLLIKNFSLFTSLLLYIGLIVWPNIFYNLFNVELIYLILFNILIYFLIINHLKKLNKFSKQLSNNK